MKIERTKNAARNIVFGIILKLYQILMPFLMRTAMIYFLGVEYLGLNSLFTSILQVLNLAELGIGNAMVYSMYKPIAEDDRTTICALMKLYRTYYRIIGTVIAVAGLLLTPFIHMLVRKDFPPELNVYVLYIMNLAATVLSYWLFAYKNSLFHAHQRIDIPNKVMLITNTIQYILQFVVIIWIKDYYIYLLILFITQALTNIITALCSMKLYPDYRPEGSLEKDRVKEINQRIRDLFTSRLGGVIVNSADTIVISAFLGLTVLAVYQNYYFVLTSVIGVVMVIFQACTAGIGNSVIIETKEKNYNDLRKFTLLIIWLSGFCSCCLLCLYQPFMRLWVGEELMLNMGAVVCFCIYYFVYEINQLLNTYKDAAGIWHRDRFRPMVTAFSNLGMNLIMVNYWGIYGVLLSTVLSIIIVGMPWLLRNLFTTLFERERLADYLKLLFKCTSVVLLSCVVCCLSCLYIHLPGLWELVVKLLLCMIIPNVLYFLFFYRTKEFHQCVMIVDRITKQKLRLKKDKN